MYWYHRSYYLYIFGALSILLGLKMFWSSLAPLDAYTQRMMGPEPLWGRALGLLLAPVFLAAGAILVYIAWQSDTWVRH